MAFIEMTYYSTALQRTVPVRVASPGDKYIDRTYYNQPGKKFKMLLLLHGIFGSFVDWTNATRIQKWAETNNFLVVMPSGENSFYVDWGTYGSDFGKMIGIRNNKTVRVNLNESAGKLKVVEKDDQFVMEAKKLGISFGD